MERDRGFNSRTLGRVRRHWGSKAKLCSTFQFTHPGKGATVYDTVTVGVRRVSIHAPWEGCDLMCAYGLPLRWMFQFTHPGKGATETWGALEV